MEWAPVHCAVVVEIWAGVRAKRKTWSESIAPRKGSPLGEFPPIAAPVVGRDAIEPWPVPLTAPAIKEHITPSDSMTQ